MSSENNKPSNDPLESAIVAMKNAAVGNERPPAALVAATIETLRRLDTANKMGASAEPAAVPQRPSSRYRRAILWAAALAA
ncbi:MAG TPA: hypothetical protein VGH32_07130, partial [Pirellulales bacterium]